MPIYLTYDPYNPSGPDGQGRNRLRVDAISPQPRCAFKPRTYAALWEAHDTSRAQWSDSYDYCTNGGDCQNCPFGNGEFKGKVPASFADDLYIREIEDGATNAGQPMAMNRPDKGFAEFGKWGFTWTDVFHCPDRYAAKFGRDEHSRYVILRRKSHAE